MRALMFALALAVCAAPVLAQPAQAPGKTGVAKTTAAARAIPVAPAAQWRVVPASSSIGFASSMEGTAFRGVFTRWSATIRFDPANLAGSSARVEVDPASANSGVADRDLTLREADWFDTARHPRAVFQSTAIRHVSGKFYEADGSLTVKGRATPVLLRFALTINGDNAEMQGALTLDRVRLGLGGAIDTDMAPAAVAVSVRVRATRIP